MSAWGAERTPCVDHPDLFSAPDLGQWRPGLGSECAETPGQRARREQIAVELCWTCPVWRQCREWALGAEDQQGSVCGGLTPVQLRKARSGVTSARVA